MYDDVKKIAGLYIRVSTIEQSILTFVKFKHIVSTSEEVDFFAFKERKNRFR